MAHRCVRLQLLLLLMLLCRYALPLNECGACSCCKNYLCHQPSGYCYDGCIDGFFGQNCTHACKSMCLTCTNLDSCSKCKSGYFGTDCTQSCMKHCQSCENSNHCTQCSSGYFASGYHCYKCPENCRLCTSSSRCTSCKDGFYNGYYYFYYYNACQLKCRSECQSCITDDSCTKCIDGKYNNLYRTCSESCYPACKACVSYNHCTVCETGKYGSTCQHNCGDGCDNNKCDKSTGKCGCVSNLFQGDKCDKCVLGKYGIKCGLECSVGCAENGCERNGDCYKALCKQGFTGNKCGQYHLGYYGTLCNKTCPINCLNCVSDKQCITCKPGFWGIECHNHCPDNCEGCISSSECDYCSPGYHGRACMEPCPENCESDLCTKTGGRCKECKVGFHGDFCRRRCPEYCKDSLCIKSSGSCISCANGYYGNSCDKSCPLHCKACSSNSFCSLCEVGYFGNYCQYKCVNCNPGTSCEKADGKCTVCADGYHGYNCNNKCKASCKTCHRYNMWKCVVCKDGLFGKTRLSNGGTYTSCNSKCPDNCRNVTCDVETGSCDHGCVKGNWGNKCTNKCSANCKDGECFSSNGSCIYGCYEGFTGQRCKCPINCKCDDKGHCVECKAEFYNKVKKCSCTKSFCSDVVCSSCTQAGYYVESETCCPCRRTCKHARCESYQKCSEGCETGYYKDDCSAKCDEIDPRCSECSSVDNMYGICKKCVNGYFPDNTSKRCSQCPYSCASGKCDAKSGICSQGCKDGKWDSKCNKDCTDTCFKCNQVNGKCSVCKAGKFSLDCTKECSEKCNATNGLRLCAKDNGACLNGCVDYFHYGTHCDKSCNVNCNNFTCDGKTGQCLNGCVVNFYGGQCDQMCSVNCVMVKHGRSCDESKGHCFAGCVDGFYGNRCDYKCSTKCVNSTCKRESGHCLNGCLYGYQGLSCSQPLEHTEAGKTDKTVTIGAAVGTAALVAIVIVAMVLIVFMKRRRNTDKTEQSGRLNENNGENTAVAFNEILPRQMQSDHNDDGAIYAKPKKPKKENEDTKNIHKKRNKKTVSNADIDNSIDITDITVSNLDKQPIADNQRAVYENNTVRYLVPRISANNETLTVSVDCELEIEEDPEAFKDSKKDAQSCSLEAEGEDAYYNVAAVKKRKKMVDQLADFVSKEEMVDFVEEFQLCLTPDEVSVRIVHPITWLKPPMAIWFATDRSNAQFPTGLTKPYIESQKRENVSQNRYKGIYPYDETRVILKEGDSDYINASYIDGYIKRGGYIASIGPTYKYMGDMSAFWRMVWQEKVVNIVMLTNLIEAGTKKCDQYWPGKDFSQLYGDIQVTCYSEDIYADYTVRFFVAQKGSERRSIGQAHFTAWPDKGIPDGVTSLIEFRQKVNSIKTNLDVPLLVHCSAGIGRTGTYIALDRLTIEGEVEGGVDIYACVRNMREQRVNMVQTVEQYRYLHNALVHILTFDSKAVELSKFSEYMSTHAESHFEETFHKIQSFVESRPDDEIDAVKRNKTLKDKNREGADIPGDRNRPRLYLNQHADSSAYINAVYINGFKSRNRYLITQTPLTDTVDDFLRLIVQENVSCIVDMESNMTRNKDVGGYYPDDYQTFTKGSFTIQSEPGENTDQYICRKLKILHDKNSKEIIVKHIQFKKWNDKKKTPDEPAKFVQFVKELHVKYYSGEVEGPVLVHCLTGAEKSGLFCVVSILLEKMQIEQELSVVNTVRQIKYRRQMSIPNKEQYVFCYQCLNEYLRSFDTYANFGLKV